MRKITRAACDAFLHGRDWSSGNTSVIVNGAVRMYLHGNLIAEMRNGDDLHKRTIRVTLAGWPTPTTRERLNGILSRLGIPARIFQRAHAQYLGRRKYEKEITAYEWVEIM